VAGVLAGAIAAPGTSPGLATDLQPFTPQLTALPSGAVVLTDRTYGSVLLDTYPALDIPIQGYGDVFTDTELQRYDALADLAPGWKGTLRQLDPSAALLDPHTSLAYALTQLGWQVAARSGQLEFLVRERAGT
jgi:hypothetical protein